MNNFLSREKGASKENGGAENRVVPEYLLHVAPPGPLGPPEIDALCTSPCYGQGSSTRVCLSFRTRKVIYDILTYASASSASVWQRLTLLKSISGCCDLNFSSISIFFISSDVGFPICYTSAPHAVALKADFLLIVKLP